MKNIFQFRGDSERCRALLQQTQITVEGPPGTILRDVEVLLDAIGTDGVASKSRNGNLPTNRLARLNEAMADPVELGLKRPLLRNYPNLMGVLLLLRSMELVVLRGQLTCVDASALDRWRSFGPVERYFALLETWFLRADATLLDQRAGAMPASGNLFGTLQFLSELPASKWKTFSDTVHIYQFHGDVPDWAAQLHQRFGFAELRPVPVGSATGQQGWRMEQAIRTSWGTAVTWALHEFFKKHEALLWEAGRSELKYGFLKTAFGAYFPDGKSEWGIRAPESQPGTYVFAVTPERGEPVEEFLRVFRIPGDYSLDSLVYVFLRSISFDFEHGYEIRYRSEQARTCQYFGGFWMNEGPYADEIAIEDAELGAKRTLRLVYDFGAGWHFKIKLLRVEPEDPALEKPELLESRGKGPEQYPSYDM